MFSTRRSTWRTTAWVIRQSWATLIAPRGLQPATERRRDAAPMFATARALFEQNRRRQGRRRGAAESMTCISG